MMQRHIRIFPRRRPSARLLPLSLFFWIFLSLALVSGAHAALTAQHEAGAFTPGGTVSVTVTIGYDTAVSALGMRVYLPENWSYLYCTGSGQPDTAQTMSSGQVEFAWVSVPDQGETGASLSFTYLVQVPASEAETRSIEADVFYRIGDGAEQQTAAVPDPLPMVRSGDGEEFVTGTQTGGAFVPGQCAQVEIALSYSGTLSALGVVVDLPEGWSFASVDGSGAPGGLPPVGATGSVEFYWTDPPASPAVFNCLFQTPADGDSAVEVSSQIVYRRLGGEVTVPVAPDPLELSWVAPVVEGVTPSEIMNNNEEVDVVITGRYFVSGSRHTLRFIASDNVFGIESLPSDSTHLTVAFPSGVPSGLYRVRVINENGVSTKSTATLKVVAAETPLPIVTDVRPQSGSALKNVQIAIYGENFEGAEEVRLCGGETVVALESFSVENDTHITGTVPAGCAEGVYDVRVTVDGRTNEVSTVKYRVCTPVVVNSSSTEAVATESMVTLEDDLDGILPVDLTLKSRSDDSLTAVSDDSIEVEAVMEAGTRLERADGTAYSGDLMMPVQVKVTDEVAEDFGGKDVVMFEMGSAEESIFLSEPMVVSLKVRRNADEGVPQVFYLEADGTTSLAGIEAERAGVSYKKGGTVLEERENEPEEGRTTYAIGLLLDHMSTFVVGNKTGSSATFGGDNGGCFIHTSGEELRLFARKWRSRLSSLFSR